MAQLLVRNIDETTKRRLKKRAEANGRSLEGEVREILRSAADAGRESVRSKSGKGFGTLFHSYFKDIGVDLEPMPKEYAKPIDFE